MAITNSKVPSHRRPDGPNPRNPSTAVASRNEALDSPSGPSGPSTAVDTDQTPCAHAVLRMLRHSGRGLLSTNKRTGSESDRKSNHSVVLSLFPRRKDSASRAEEEETREAGVEAEGALLLLLLLLVLEVVVVCCCSYLSIGSLDEETSGRRGEEEKGRRSGRNGICDVMWEDIGRGGGGGGGVVGVY
ncbi:hypothetical protein AXG93_421s1080 [Marchantia polymorpha subsp. ruderalis]|uniref:Uncharacterized protein n=1 Tax=Marchantia polymorpha subsp. ruderalis TaxID=1480154 RepID=A0A176VJC4_MARPO|nr:hypothetical protein AXG93_421s1080 [Marchantia polymorpha subsp. ruderalis]